MSRQRNIDKLQQAEHAAREELARSQTALRIARTNLRKVRQQERERVIHELGRLAYEAGLHQLDRETLKARFASLAVERNSAGLLDTSFHRDPKMFHADLPEE